MVVEKFRVTSELNFTKNNIFYYNLKTIKASAILLITEFPSFTSTGILHRR